MEPAPLSSLQEEGEEEREPAVEDSSSAFSAAVVPPRPATYSQSLHKYAPFDWSAYFDEERRVAVPGTEDVFFPQAVENKWGGHESHAKADQLGESILSWFCNSKFFICVAACSVRAHCQFNIENWTAGVYQSIIEVLLIDRFFYDFVTTTLEVLICCCVHLGTSHGGTSLRS